MTSDPDTLPTRADPHGPCPRCGRAANFEVVSRVDLRRGFTGNFGISAESGGRTVPNESVVEQLTVLKCMGCQRNLVVVEAEISNPSGLEGVLWWPMENIVDLEQRAGVPHDVVAAYSEGVRCLSVKAPNAAAAMFRTTIAQIIQNKGSEAAKAKRNLNDAIDQMDDDKTMWPGFADWAHHVRDTGNAGAHTEKFNPLTMEQAEDLRAFVREIVNFLYVQPARRAAAKPATKKGAAAPTSAGPGQITPDRGGPGRGPDPSSVLWAECVNALISWNLLEVSVKRAALREDMNDRFARVDERFAGIEERFSSFDRRLRPGGQRVY